MNNVQIQFLDCNLSPLGGRKVLFTPVKSPEISASWLTTADSYQYTTSLNGSLTSSVVANNYKVDILSPLPATSFFLSVSETGSFVYSGSVRPGDSQDVFFDLFNLVKDPTTVKRLTLTPAWNYPVPWSGSIIALCSTSSIPVNGFAEYTSLIPGVYQVDALGKVDTSFFISVPGSEYTGSTAPKWNAKDLLIVKPSKGIPVRLYNGDSSYVLTVSSSDARYVRYGPSGSFIVYSASYAGTADSSSYAGFASTAGSAGTSTFASMAYTATTATQSLSASIAQTAKTASFVTASNVSGVVATSSLAFNSVSASYAGTASVALNVPATASHALFADSSSYALTASVALNIPLSASYAVQALTASNANTASYALNVPVTASFAVTSSNANTASFVISASHAVNADTASLAIFSLNALSASYAPESGTITNAETASLAIYCPAYVLKAGDTMNGTLEMVSGGGLTLDNSSTGVIFKGGTPDDFNLKLLSNDLLGLVDRFNNYIYFTGGNISASMFVGTASYANYALTASFASSSEHIIFTTIADFAATASWSATASYITSSGVVGKVKSSSLADTASLATRVLVQNAGGLGLTYPIAILNPGISGGNFVVQDTSGLEYEDGTKSLLFVNAIGTDLAATQIQATAVTASLKGNADTSTTASTMTAVDGFGDHWNFDGIRWNDPVRLGVPILQLVGGASPSVNLNGEMEIFATSNSSTPLLYLGDDAANPFIYNLMEVRDSGTLLAAINRSGKYVGTSSWADNVTNSQTASYVLGSNVDGPVFSASYAITASALPDNTDIFRPVIYDGVLASTTSIDDVTVLRALYLDIFSVVKASPMTLGDLQNASNLPLNLSTSLWNILSGSAALTSSFALTASYVSSSNVRGTILSSSYAGTASVLLGSIVSASYALTASFALNGGGTGGNQVSCSWASSSLSSSYAFSASYASSSFYAQTASILSWMNTSSSMNPATSAVVIVDEITGSYTSAWYDYTCTSSSIAQRAGTVMATFDGNGNVDYTDLSTPNLNGDTSDLVLRVAISESHVRLVSDASSYTWNVKSVARYI